MDISIQISLFCENALYLPALSSVPSRLILTALICLHYYYSLTIRTTHSTLNVNAIKPSAIRRRAAPRSENRISVSCGLPVPSCASHHRHRRRRPPTGNIRHSASPPSPSARHLNKPTKENLHTSHTESAYLRWLSSYSVQQ